MFFLFELSIVVNHRLWKSCVHFSHPEIESPIITVVLLDANQAQQGLDTGLWSHMAGTIFNRTLGGS